jgi:filamentous hemagglutinin family protein
MKKSIRGKRNSWRRKLVTVAVASCFAGEVAYANPLGAVVVNGQVSFSTSGNLLQITNTPGAIINWRGFSISANEITRFIQQSASSSVMNRVTGVDPSVILGTLASNGRVFLINPNGITFGMGSVVDVGGLVASTDRKSVV